MTTDLAKNNSGRRRTLGLVTSLIFLTIIAGFAFYVNRTVRLEALYMDDLYMWSFYGEQNIWEFSFPFRTAERFRPVYWFLTYLQMAIVGAHVRGYLTFNIITNIILACTIYGIATHISGNRIVAFLAALCYLASRFSYYQIGQALGFMETLACFFGLWVLFFLYEFMMRGGDAGTPDAPMLDAPMLDAPMLDAPMLDTKGILYFKLSERCCFWLAIVAYVLVSFTHERYTTLAGLFYVALFIMLLRTRKGSRKAWLGKNLVYWIVPAATFAAIMLIRFIFIGTSIPGGTGGTEVTETLSISQTMRFCVSQVLYLLGINDGPEYLCGISWENTPANVRNLIKLSIVCYGIIGLGFIVSMIKDLCKKENRTYDNTDTVSFGKRLFCRKIAVSLLFATFVAICILFSSVTIRVEMRWVYVSFAAMQLFACYMIRSIGSVCGEPGAVACAFSIHNDGDAGDENGDAADNGTGGSGGAASRKAVNWAVLAALAVYLTYVLLSMKTNFFCRGYINNIYFMEGQNRANSIADQTINKFGADEVLGKYVFLVDTNYDISDFYCDYFFKPFDPEKTGQGSRLVMVKRFEDSFQYMKDHPSPTPPKPPKSNPDGNISEKAIYLTEDPTTGQYIPLNVVN